MTDGLAWWNMSRQMLVSSLRRDRLVVAGPDSSAQAGPALTATSRLCPRGCDIAARSSESVRPAESVRATRSLFCHAVVVS